MPEDIQTPKDIMQIADRERGKLRDAFIALNTQEKFRFPGNRVDKPLAGRVSYWFKQDEIHLSLVSQEFQLMLVLSLPLRV